MMKQSAWMKPQDGGLTGGSHGNNTEYNIMGHLKDINGTFIINDII